jgi:ABC-2 type transport system ATP-binding protein
VGLDPTRQAVAVKRKVGYLPDAVGFYANLTGRQNLHYTARLNRIAPEDAERRIDALLDQVGLAQRTVLLSSHLLGQVQAICDRIGIFVGGRLVACGTIEELGAAHGGRLVVEVEAVGGDPEPVLRSLPEVVRVQRDGDRLLLGAQRDVRADVARALAAAGLVPVHLRLRAEELGAIYHRYFAEEEADAASVG